MRRRCFAALIAALLFLCVPAQAQVIVYEVFGAYLDSLRDQAGIPGLAAAIVDTNGIVWERAYGRQDIDRALAMRTDTPFNADGLTQTMTAAMVLRCVEERRLSLDDSVGTFGVATTEPDATVRQLLTHTSGAPDNLAFLLRPEAARAVVADRPHVRRLVSRVVRESAPPSRDVRLGSRSQYRHRCDARGRRAPSTRRRALRRAPGTAGYTIFCGRSQARAARRRIPIPQSRWRHRRAWSRRSAIWRNSTSR